MFLSYAQNYEDVRLSRCFPGKHDGFYVDVGASSPIALSVTQAFHERGWRGINIDPIAERIAEFDRLRPRDRNLCCLAGAEPGSGTLMRPPGCGELASAAPLSNDRQKTLMAGAWAIECPQRTLAEILDTESVTAIDFLKIDVEGAEREVIQGMDFRRWRPAVLVVEATLPATIEPSHAEWEPLLLEQDYIFAHFDALSRFYVRAENADLAAVLTRPISMFDGFRRAVDMGSPLRNPSHPEHAFALHLARLLLRATTLDTTERLLAELTRDMPPAALTMKGDEKWAHALYIRVFGREAPAGWAAWQGLTAGELLLALLRREEFAIARGRVSLG